MTDKKICEVTIRVSEELKNAINDVAMYEDRKPSEIWRMAADLDQAPGNLSVMLSDDGQRHFDTGLLELYVQKTGDLSPIHYLVAKYCGDRSAVHDDALQKIQQVLSELPTLLASAGIAKRRK